MAELRADPFASAWSPGIKSAARLIAAAAPVAGSYRAGVEIRLDDGAHTYWRTPGEAGAAPIFDFTGSENIKNATIHYPAPWRIDEAGFDLFGYTGGVTFPVDVEFMDAGRPAVLKLSLDYAVCSSICLPVKAKAALALPVRPPAFVEASVEGAPENATLAAAAAKVPLRVGAADRDKQIDVTRAEGTSQPTWRVRVKAARGVDGERLSDPERPGPDVFVESPDGWYFESRKGDDPNEFLIVEVERPHVGKGGPDDKAAKIPLTVTLADRRQSYEFELELDALVTP